MSEVTPGFTIDPTLVENLADYARLERLSPQEAFETALGLGLELCLSEVGEREGRLRHLEASVRDLHAVVTLLGPPALGVLKLLVAWAAREGFGVSDDELFAEVLAAARSEWELALAERGVVTASVPEA